MVCSLRPNIGDCNPSNEELVASSRWVVELILRHNDVRGLRRDREYADFVVAHLTDTSYAQRRVAGIARASFFYHLEIFKDFKQSGHQLAGVA